MRARRHDYSQRNDHLHRVIDAHVDGHDFRLPHDEVVAGGGAARGDAAAGGGRRGGEVGVLRPGRHVWHLRSSAGMKVDSNFRI